MFLRSLLPSVPAPGAWCTVAALPSSSFAPVCCACRLPRGSPISPLLSESGRLPRPHHSLPPLFGHGGGAGFLRVSHPRVSWTRFSASTALCCSASVLPAGLGHPSAACPALLPPPPAPGLCGSRASQCCLFSCEPTVRPVEPAFTGSSLSSWHTALRRLLPGTWAAGAFPLLGLGRSSLECGSGVRLSVPCVQSRVLGSTRRSPWDFWAKGGEKGGREAIAAL